MNPISDQIKAARDKSAAAAKRQALAFQEVFGQEKHRSSSQKIVMAALATLCGQESAHALLDKEGRIDPSSAVFFEGSRRVYLFIDGQIKAAVEKQNP